MRKLTEEEVRNFRGETVICVYSDFETKVTNHPERDLPIGKKSHLWFGLGNWYKNEDEDLIIHEYKCNVCRNCDGISNEKVKITAIYKLVK